MAELISVFELATGMPFTYRPSAPARRRRYQPDPVEAKEEQGKVWWNAGQEASDDELDPVEIEAGLLARAPGPFQPAGETEAEWRARGGVPKVLPPGKAYVL